MSEKPSYESLEARVKELEKKTEKREQAGQPLGDSQDTSVGLLDAMDEIAVLLDSDLRYLAANEPAARALNIDRRDFVGRKVLGILPPQVAERRVGHANEVLQTGKPVEFEDEMDGRLFFNRIVPVHDGDGSASKLAVYCRDITERKQAEAALRESEQNLAITLDSIGDAVIATDAEGYVTRMNPVAEDLTGWSLPQAQGLHLNKIFRIVHEETRNTVESPVDKVLREGFVVGLANHTVLIAKDGTERPIDDSGAPIRDSKGAIAGVVLVFRDVTEKRAAEKRMDHLNAVLRAIRNVNQLITREKDRDRLIQGACDNLLEARGFHNAWAALVDKDDSVISIAGGGDEGGVVSLQQELEQGKLPTCCKKAEVESGIIVIEDPGSTCDCPLSENCAKLSSSAMAAPLEYDDRIYGFLVVSIPKGCATDEEEQDLFEEVTGDIAFGLHDIGLEERRKQAESSLEAREAFLDRIIEQSPFPTWISDAEGTLQRANPALKRFLNLTDEQLVGNYNVLEDPLVERQGLMPLIRTVYEEGKTVSFSCEWDGNDIPTMDLKGSNSVSIEATMFPIYSPEGELTNVVLNWVDVTERKKAEGELRKRKDEYELLFNSGNDAIFVHGINDRNPGKFVEVNEIACNRLGYSRDELLDLTPLDIDGGGTDESRQHALATLVETGESVFEMIHVTKRGEEIPVEISSRVFESDGAPYVLSIARDISDRKREEAEKNMLESQLRQVQKMESIGTLAGGIAHDFNNALTPIMVQTDLAKLTIPADNPVQENFDEIMKAGHRAKDLVRQILAFSRQSAQQRISMDLAPMIKESLKLLRSSIPTTIEIRREIEAGSCPVWADPTQMQQIIMNLCTNASHAMQETGGILEVDLKTVELDGEAAKAYPNIGPGRYVMLTVSDTGVGIEPELMEKIFDPFFTTKPVNEGTGMGLSVVHGIVRSHEGDITVRSEPGNGAGFSVLLPRLAREAKVELEASDRSVPTGSERVLLVDDEEAMVKAAEQMLNKLGYHVESTTRAVDALAAFREQPDTYDLVITDMTMPNMTGENLAEALMRVRPDIPVILCTGFSHQMDEEKALDMGIRAFVMKPFDFKDVAQTIRRVLDSQPAKR